MQGFMILAFIGTEKGFMILGIIGTEKDTLVFYST